MFPNQSDKLKVVDRSRRFLSLLVKRNEQIQDFRLRLQNRPGLAEAERCCNAGDLYALQKLLPSLDLAINQALGIV